MDEKNQPTPATPYDRTWNEDPLKFYNPSNSNHYYANIPGGLYIETYGSDDNISSVFIPKAMLIINETIVDVPEDEDEGDKAFKLRKVLAKIVEYHIEVSNGWKKYDGF